MNEFRSDWIGTGKRTTLKEYFEIFVAIMMSVQEAHNADDSQKVRE